MFWKYPKNLSESAEAWARINERKAKEAQKKIAM